MRKKKSVLGAIFIFLGVLFVATITGLCIWTEVKHDKPIWTYIKDEIQENKDEKQQEVEDEIAVEDENGETTAVIKF